MLHFLERSGADPDPGPGPDPGSREMKFTRIWRHFNDQNVNPTGSIGIDFFVCLFVS